MSFYKDVVFQNNQLCFNFRVSGILKVNNMILLHKKKGDQFWNLIGGRVKLGEFSDAAVKREFWEEVKIDLKVKELKGVVENKFKFKEMIYHEILMIYEVSLNQEQDDIWEKNGEEDLVFKWFHIEDIKKLDIKPECSKKIILDSTKEIIHITNDEIR